MSLNLDMPDVFFLIRPGLLVWGRNTTEEKCNFHYNMSRLHTTEHYLSLLIYLDFLAEVVFPGFSTKVTLFFAISIEYALEGTPCVFHT